MTQPSTDSAALRQHVIDRDGIVWRVVRDGGMATRADFTGIESIGIETLRSTRGPLVDLGALLDERDRLREALKLLTPFEPQHAAECAHERFVTPPCDCGATAANHAARAALAQSEEARP